MDRTLTPLNNYSDLQEAIRSAGAWFIGSFMMEFVDNYEKFQDKKTKTEYIESGMVVDAMKYVINCNDNSMDCEESKVNAQYLLDCLKNGDSILPMFED